MKLRRRRQEVPGLNTTATADISFILLIFFLVTTSMDVDKGLMRQLPPKQKNEKRVETAVEKENLLAITISADGSILENDSLSSIDDLTAHLADFIQRRGVEHLITIDADPNSAYEPYFHVTNSVIEAYKIERNRLSQLRFKKDFADLDADERMMILDICPQRVAENYHEKGGDQ